MADFRTHVTTSSVLGIGYAGMGLTMGLTIETAIVGGGLCGVSGMLPDLDSDTGIPIRESTGFAAGILPMLLVDRFQAVGMPYDRMILITAVLYFLIRFAGASLLGRFSVHRGMFHSLPAALIFAGLAFLICGYAEDRVRYFKAGAVFFGVMSHLVLDELYSIEWKGGSWRLKRSFGTALKLWGKNGWANFSAYAKLAIVGVMVAGEPSVMGYLESKYPEFAGNVQRFHSAQEDLFDNVRDRVLPGGESALTGDGNRALPEQADNAAFPSQPAAAPLRPQPLPTQSMPVQPKPAQPWTPSPPPLPDSGFPASGFPANGFPASGNAFTPNAGRSQPGTAEPVYRADGRGFGPR